MLSIIFSTDQFLQLNINVIYASHGKNIWKYENQKANIISFWILKKKVCEEQALKVNKMSKLIRETKNIQYSYIH